MSRIAPDLPELEHVPEATRSLVYVGALNRAIRSPVTWLIGAAVIAAGAGIGLMAGRAVLGGIGAVAGAAAGAAAAIWCFFTVVLPWRTRRVLPSAIDQGGGRPFADVGDADQRLRRMIDEVRIREAGATDRTAERRPSDRSP